MKEKPQKKRDNPWLKLLLDELHMTVPEICLLLGISVDTYYAYYHGESRPTQPRRQRMKHALMLKADRISRLAREL